MIGLGMRMSMSSFRTSTFIMPLDKHKTVYFSLITTKRTIHSSARGRSGKKKCLH